MLNLFTGREHWSTQMRGSDEQMRMLVIPTAAGVQLNSGIAAQLQRLHSRLHSRRLW